MIYRAYKYCFYHFYKYGLKRWGERHYPQYWASSITAIFIVLNFYTLLLLIQTIFGVGVFSIIGRISRPIFIVLILSLLFLNDFLLVKNGRYKNIVHEFESDKLSESQKQKRATYLGLYTLISVVSLFVSGWIFIAKS